MLALGQASDATVAMELGCDGVLVNTAIAKAKNPFQMAVALKNAVIAGRQSYLIRKNRKVFILLFLHLQKRVNFFKFFYNKIFSFKFFFFILFI